MAGAPVGSSPRILPIPHFGYNGARGRNLARERDLEEEAGEAGNWQWRCAARAATARWQEGDRGAFAIERPPGLVEEAGRGGPRLLRSVSRFLPATHRALCRAEDRARRRRAAGWRFQRPT